MPTRSQVGREEGILAGPCLLVVRLLLVVTLLVDGYLAWVSFSGGGVAGCGPASNCHTVLTSKWAYWFGIPVSTAALPVYGSLLVSSFFLGSQTAPRPRRTAWQLVLALSTMAIAAGLWFVGLQVLVLKTICPFCMTAHSCAVVAGVLLLAKVPLRAASLPGSTGIPVEDFESPTAIDPGEPREGRQPEHGPIEPLTPRVALGLMLAALAGVAVLIAGQVLHQAKTYVSSAISAGPVTNTVVLTARQYQILDGKFELNLVEVPVVGRIDAPHILVSLFDYTCHHCREMHGPLGQAVQHFSNELAMVNLPMPLDGKCNHLVKATLPAHTNACALARVGLTVWRADRKAAPKFDDWVFAPATPPVPEAAEAYARNLVGAEAFDRAATNSWVDLQIHQDCAIFEAVYRKFRKGTMPQIIVGTNLITGTFTSGQLSQMLVDQFGLKGPVPTPDSHP